MTEGSYGMSQDFEPIPEPADDEVLVLKPQKKLKKLIFAIVYFPLAVSYLYTAQKGDLVHWFFAILFGCVVITFAVDSLPNSCFLRLTPEGLTIRNGYIPRSYKWTDIHIFYAGFFHNKETVLFDFSDSYESPALERAVSNLSGYGGFLPETYSMSPERLAELLNVWREHFSRGEDADGSVIELNNS